MPSLEGAGRLRAAQRRLIRVVRMFAFVLAVSVVLLLGSRGFSVLRPDLSSGEGQGTTRKVQLLVDGWSAAVLHDELEWASAGQGQPKSSWTLVHLTPMSADELSRVAQHASDVLKTATGRMLSTYPKLTCD